MGSGDGRRKGENLHFDGIRGNWGGNAEGGGNNTGFLFWPYDSLQLVIKILQDARYNLK